jgi:hypothetical protein
LQPQGRCAVPLQAGKKARVPDKGKDEQAGDEGDEVIGDLKAQFVMNVGDGLLSGGDAEEMEVEGQSGEETGAQQTEERKHGQEKEMAEIRNMRRRECFRLGPGVEERQFGGGLLRARPSIFRRGKGILKGSKRQWGRG